MRNDGKSACPFVKSAYVEQVQKLMKIVLYALQPLYLHQILPSGWLFH
jgi:hypothetical protein